MGMGFPWGFPLPCTPLVQGVADRCRLSICVDLLYNSLPFCCTACCTARRTTNGRRIDAKWVPTQQHEENENVFVPSPVDGRVDGRLSAVGALSRSSLEHPRWNVSNAHARRHTHGRAASQLARYTRTRTPDEKSRAPPPHLLIYCKPRSPSEQKVNRRKLNRADRPRECGRQVTYSAGRNIIPFPAEWFGTRTHTRTLPGMKELPAWVQ